MSDIDTSNATTSAKVLFIVSGATYWVMKDGTRYATGYWAEEFASDVLDRGRAFAVLEIQLVCHAELFGLIRAGGRTCDVDQPVRVRERQRTEQRRVHDREDGGIGAEDQRQRSRAGNEIARTPTQGAPRVQEVRSEFVHAPTVARRGGSDQRTFVLQT